MELTVKEAIKQGYKYYGISGLDHQSCQSLDENIFEEVDDYNHDNIVLFDKKFVVTSVSEEEIKEMVSDHVSVKHSEECYSDDDRIYNAISSLDFSEIINNINKKLEEHKYYFLTDIKIIK